MSLCAPSNHEEFEDDNLKIQIGGSHYKKFSIQPIEFITKNNLGYIEGNIIKYICRYKDKNGIEDLKKAKHYLDILIQNEKLETLPPMDVLISSES